MSDPEDSATGQPPDIPQGWRSTAELRGAPTVDIRPISPHDAAALTAFHGTLSDATIYLRYFAPHPHLSASDLAYLTGVDHRDRVALVAWHETRIVGVGRFDRLGVGLAHSTAEAAFVVCDEFQGHGLGTVLLAHLIEAAIDRDIRVLEAEVLPQNGRMLTTFEHAGYPLTRRYDQGVVRLALELAQAADDRMAP